MVLEDTAKCAQNQRKVSAESVIPVTRNQDPGIMLYS